jgi:dolichol-phosphate mannosyltransferase
MTTTADAGIELSVVIPLFNEAANIAVLVERLVTVLDSIDRNYEVLIVDDGSRDNTWQLIQAAATRHPRLSGIRLSRNFGHQHALLAGLTLARGAAVVSMDGDLQHPPEVVSLLLERWRSGQKIVYTKRVDEHRLGWFKRISSRLFYAVFSWMSGVQIEPGSSDFRLIDRQILNELLRFHDVDLFLRGAVQWLGFHDVSSTVEFRLADRYAGRAKYDLRRMLRLASSGIVSFSRKPLIIGIWLGVITSLLAFLELAFIFYSYLQGDTLPGWASTIGIMAFLFGILFAILGIIGLYLASIHTALQGRPRFIISAATSASPNTEATHFP